MSLVWLVVSFYLWNWEIINLYASITVAVTCLKKVLLHNCIKSFAIGDEYYYDDVYFSNNGGDGDGDNDNDYNDDNWDKDVDNFVYG